MTTSCSSRLSRPQSRLGSTRRMALCSMICFSKFDLTSESLSGYSVLQSIQPEYCPSLPWIGTVWYLISPIIHAISMQPSSENLPFASVSHHVLEFPSSPSSENPVTTTTLSRFTVSLSVSPKGGISVPKFRQRGKLKVEIRSWFNPRAAIIGHRFLAVDDNKFPYLLSH